MDNPAGLPEGIGGCPRDESLFPRTQRQGIMGGRQVSETRPALQVPPVRESRPVGASAVHGSIRSRVAVAGSASSSGLVPSTQPGLQGASSAAPRSTEPVADYLSANRRLRDLRSLYNRQHRQDIVKNIDRAMKRFSSRILNQLGYFGGDEKELEKRPFGTTKGEQAYRNLLDMARRANEPVGSAKSDRIVTVLESFDLHVDRELKALIAKHRVTEVLPSPPAPALPTAKTTAAAKTALTEATPLRAETTGDFDWIGAIRQLQQAHVCFEGACTNAAYQEIQAARIIVASRVKYCFNTLGGDRRALPALSADVRTVPEQYYRAIEAMYREAREAKDEVRTGIINGSLETLHDGAAIVLHSLTNKWGPLDNLSIQAAVPGQPPPMTDAANRGLAGPLNQGSGNLPPAVPGNADPPEESSFLSAVQSLLMNKRLCTGRGDLDEAHKTKLAYDRVAQYVKRRYQLLGGEIATLQGDGRGGQSKAEQIYFILEGAARQAQEVNDQTTFENIRAILHEFEDRAVSELFALTCKERPNSASSTRGVQQPPAAAAPAFVAPTLQAHSSTPGSSNWEERYRQIRDLIAHFSLIGRDVAVADFREAENSISGTVNRFFGGFCRGLETSPVQGQCQATIAERQYRALADLLRQTIAEGDTWRHQGVCHALQVIHLKTQTDLQLLSDKYGPLDALGSSAEIAGQQASTGIGLAVPGTTVRVPVITEGEWID